MKFILAPDSFKECMTAHQATLAMEAGLRRVFPTAEIIAIPMADGGEGTVDALTTITQGQLIEHSVTDPLGRPIQASFGLSADRSTAFIEVAAASGLPLLSPAERNPLIASSYGTGQQILAALDYGVSKLVIGLGGSATNDGGQGIAAALGATFYDRDERQIFPQGGAALTAIHRVDLSHCDPRLQQVEITLASDVTNTLTGKQGASAIFGPQKGATPEMVEQLDNALANYGRCLELVSGKEVTTLPGSGAAGGIGATLLALSQATLQPGIELVMQYANFEQALVGADAVLTGEGAIDNQTLYGKTPYGVAKAVRTVSRQIPVIALAGKVASDIDALYQHGFTAIFAINPQAQSLAEALATGPQNLTQTVENVARLLNIAAVE